jgi:uncharacterized protein YqgQ
MTEFIQRFLLNNTKWLQHLVNDKLAKRKGGIGKFFSWMEIGPRNYGQHIFPKYFRLWNSIMLDFGFRWNWGRPHLTKIFTRERDIFIVGYGAFFILWAWFARKNRIRPLFMYNDFHLHHYDNPTRLTKKFGMYVPFNVMNYVTSAHYLEINKIYHQEILKKYLEVKETVRKEFNKSSEKVRRTKYALNKNYVYEPFGWELNRELK